MPRTALLPPRLLRRSLVPLLLLVFPFAVMPARAAGEPDPRSGDASASSPERSPSPPDAGLSTAPAPTSDLEAFLLAGAQHLRQDPDISLPAGPAVSPGPDPRLDSDPAAPLAPEPAPDSGLAPAPDPAALRDRLDQILTAIEDYRTTGEAAVLKRSTRDIFPFDESQPTLNCSPLVVCDVELEPGEIVTDVALGAPRLWDAREMVSGDPENPTPHVIVWPLDYDLATNAVIATTRRTYHLDLVSPSKDEVVSGEVPFHRHVSFYYPAEVVRRWNELETVRRREAERESERSRSAVVAPLAAVDLDALRTDYTVRAAKDVHWVPSLVFDDGRQTFLRFPSHVRAGNLPTLLVETGRRSFGVANFRWSPDGRWMIYDGVFPRARLVAGVGRQQRKVEIRQGARP